MRKLWINALVVKNLKSIKDSTTEDNADKVLEAGNKNEREGNKWQTT